MAKDSLVNIHHGIKTWTYFDADVKFIALSARFILAPLTFSSWIDAIVLSRLEIRVALHVQEIQICRFQLQKARNLRPGFERDYHLLYLKYLPWYTVWELHRTWHNYDPNTVCMFSWKLIQHPHYHYTAKKKSIKGKDVVKLVRSAFKTMAGAKQKNKKTLAFANIPVPWILFLNM